MRPTHIPCQRLTRLSLLLLAVTLGCTAGASSSAAHGPTARQHQADRTRGCEPAGSCAAPVGLTETAAALGILEPSPGLLPSGTISVTLSNTTTAPADCRWSGNSGISYAAMPGKFQSGQGTTSHSTVVSGLHDLDDRWFYVRCQDLSGGRDPDSAESATHLRVLGPWSNGYPRIANLWPVFSDALTPDFLAGYDLLIPYFWRGHADLLAAARRLNPSLKILHTQYGTKGRPGLDPLAAAWWNSQPGDPGYNCLLRNSRGEILLVENWGHPMYNMTQPYCRQVVTERNIGLFLSSLPEEGDNLAYDGIYWDLLHGDISWLAADIDSDLDGRPDDPVALDAAYEAGIKDFLAQVRAALPHGILMGNEAPAAYAPWINGRLWEWQLGDILNGATERPWDSLIADFRQWTGRGQAPRLKLVLGSPEPFYARKYPFQHVEEMPPAMKEEATASYQRMRYGLVSALMSDALFAYDFGPEQHGDPWWYDEFGAPGNGGEPTLPGRGYLGQPAEAPALLVDRLNTPDQLMNGQFEKGLDRWNLWVDRTAGAAATLDLDATGGISGTAAAHIRITNPVPRSSVLFLQRYVSSMADQSYTLSFWARADVTRTLRAKVTKASSGDANYGFEAQTVVTPEWQHFRLWHDAAVTAADGQLTFQVGGDRGELWLDNIEFQEGALGVWARRFQNGLGVINTTGATQTARLPGAFCKLNGGQAPLFQARVEDNQALASEGWSQQPADGAQFGDTVHVARGGSAATMTYTPNLAYSGTYEVLAWVAPAAIQSSGVSVTIHDREGQTAMQLDETVGEIGWRSLGTYVFDAGSAGSASLAATGQGTVVADAFKWVSTARFNDGARVSEVTLQPQDGIVLLTSCFRPTGFYLPLSIRY